MFMAAPRQSPNCVSRPRGVSVFAAWAVPLFAREAQLADFQTALLSLGGIQKYYEITAFTASILSVLESI